MLSATFLLLLIGEIIVKKSSYVGFGMISILGIVASMILAFQLYRLPSSYIFFHMIVVDNFAVFFKFIFGVSTILVILFSFDSQELQRYNAGEYYCLLIAVVIGM